ncbi:MAG: TonB family protein [Chromatiales bacterium]|nr:TonB family protein [Chromatiales bacterium]
MAAGAGLLALSKELSALADTSSVNTMVNKKLNHRPGQHRRGHGGFAHPDQQYRQQEYRGSPGCARGHRLARTRLGDGQRQAAQDLLAANAAQSGASGTGASAQAQGANPRRFEDVAVVMDQHKGTLYSIYNRTRRTNPGIKGKIVLVLTIQPSGQVSNVVIKTSELNSPELEASLVARIRQFDFGKRPGGPLTVTIPVEFLPSRRRVINSYTSKAKSAFIFRGEDRIAADVLCLLVSSKSGIVDTN